MVLVVGKPVVECMLYLFSGSLVGSCAIIVTGTHKGGWRVQLALTVCQNQQSKAWHVNVRVFVCRKTRVSDAQGD
jgi:hypothetical protein